MNEGTIWGVLNLGVCINTAIIAGRLFWRAATESDGAGARILYGTMFLAVSVFFAILSVSQWFYDDGRPAAGLVGLALIWLATTVAVIYLLVWGRTRRGGMR